LLHNQFCLGKSCSNSFLELTSTR